MLRNAGVSNYRIEPHTHPGSVIAALAILFIWMFCIGCFSPAIPREKKLADCTTNELGFRLVWPTGELFNIVLGVPYSEPTH